MEQISKFAEFLVANDLLLYISLLAFIVPLGELVSRYFKYYLITRKVEGLREEIAAMRAADQTASMEDRINSLKIGVTKYGKFLEVIGKDYEELKQHLARANQSHEELKKYYESNSAVSPEPALKALQDERQVLINRLELAEKAYHALADEVIEEAGSDKGASHGA